jgi:ABC-type transport system involved in multi-copper enzyme maturation permease subunit
MLFFWDMIFKSYVRNVRVISMHMFLCLLMLRVFFVWICFVLQNRAVRSLWYVAVAIFL